MNTPARTLLVSGLFVFLLTACNLQAGQDAETTLIEEPTVIVVTRELSPTPIVEIEEATAIPVETEEIVVAPINTDNGIVTCTPTNLHWHQYIVQAGDTLASIAAESNSTVTTLASVNCIANINQISTGQVIRVPQVPAPTLPLIDNGSVPSNVCGIEPLIAPIDIYGDGGTPFARLQGTILVTGRNDAGYFVDVPGFNFDGYALANEVRELGSNCPQVSLPVINQAPPFVAACMVVATNGQASIYRPGPASAVAKLIQAQYIRTADNAYIISTPSLGGESWVSAIETALSGENCPDDLLNLPVVSGGNIVPANGCSVVLNEPTARAGIKYGYTDVYAPIALLGNWLPYMEHLEGGYIVDMVGWDITGWIAGVNVHLEGTGCPAVVPPEDNCLEPFTIENPVTISPSTSIESNCVSVNTGTITVAYPDAPLDFSMAEFWMKHESGNTDVIGVDDNPADGASIEFLVHDSLPDSLVYVFIYVSSNHMIESGQLAVYLAD